MKHKIVEPCQISGIELQAGDELQVIFYHDNIAYVQNLKTNVTFECDYECLRAFSEIHY